MDEVLAARAVRERTSKAALIRRLVAEHLYEGTPEADPMAELIGRYDEEPGSIDAVVYDGR